MKNILVLTDFSNASKQAFQHALDYAKPLGAANVQLTVLTVLEDLLPASVQFEFGLTFIDAKGLLDQAEKEAVKALAKIQAEIFQGFTVSTKVLRANEPVHVEVIHYIQKHSIDMVIMSTHGRTGVKRLVLGSVAERVIRESPTPVLVVPMKHE